ncbi:uncharacterized protein LOC126329580 [Schistocerca gregaria]|uniref:uncharacterized protein LOC126329580 n=1 Tax=Schistocerca gregaria TaxID=7010 RepID=UPI00211DE06A|nr:uncharacterized protein LOC126329580 [Schistocerca gregaria]
MICLSHTETLKSIIPNRKVHFDRTPGNQRTDSGIETETINAIRCSSFNQTTPHTTQDKHLYATSGYGKAAPHKVPSLENLCIKRILHNISKYAVLDLPPYLLEVLAARMQASHLITDENIALFADLTEINVSNNHITDLGIQKILLAPRCQPLVSLDLSNISITDRSLVAISSHCHDLQNLNLSNCHALSTKYLVNALKQLTKLQHLGIGPIKNMSEDSIVQIVNLPSLKSFKCNGCPKKLKSLPAKLPSSHGSKTSNIVNLHLQGFCCLSDSLLSIVSYCSNVEVLNLDRSGAVNDASLAQIVSTLTNLSWLSIASTPNVTDLGIKELSRAKNLRSLNLSNNPYLSYPALHALVSKKNDLQLLGNTIRLKMMRDQPTLSAFILILNEFCRVEDIVKGASAYLEKEKDLVCNNRPREDGSLQLYRVACRRNGTKRPYGVVATSEYKKFVVEALENRHHLYVCQEPPKTIGISQCFSQPLLSSSNVFIILKVWNSVDSKLPITKSVYIPTSLTVKALKQELYREKLIHFPPSEALIVEEENSFKTNILSNEHLNLNDYNIISGDILHVERIIDSFHKNDEGQIIRSHIGDSLSGHREIRIRVREAKESYKNRCKYFDLNSKIFNFEIICHSGLTLLQIKHMIAKLINLDVKSVYLSTYAEPHIIIQEDSKFVADVLRGNTCILLSIHTSARSMPKLLRDSVRHFFRRIKKCNLLTYTAA